jgi:hypothetical protein
MTQVRQPVPIPDARTAAARPLTMELVGPAAAGKTSLLHALAERDGSLQAGLRPPAHRHLASAVTLLPTFLALHRPYRDLLWKEMKRITYLRTLQTLLREQPVHHAGTVALDEGPIYMLARLQVFGGARIRSDAFERWWRATIAQWAKTLDVVVSLDASNATLIHRLRARPQEHPVWGLSDAAIGRFLHSYREAYQSVIAALTAEHNLRVLVFRTDHDSLDHITETIAPEIRPHRRHP